MEAHATHASGAAPVSERFFLTAILLYVVLALALILRLAQMVAGPVSQSGPGRIAVVDWPAHKAR